MEDEILTAAELGVRLDVATETIYAMAKSGQIPSIRVSKRLLRFSWADVVASLKNQPAQVGVIDGE